MGKLIPMDPRELAAIRQRRENDAIDAASKERGGFPRLKIAGKKFSIEGFDQPDELEIVILHAAYNNVFYKGPYNAKDPQPPVCSALGWDEDLLAPSPDLETRISDRCIDCRNNEWGSGATDQSKACRNGRRIAFIFASDVGSVHPTIVLGDLPPTSAASLSKYIKNLGTLAERQDGGKGLPYDAVKTRMYFDDEKTYPKVKFDGIEEITDQSTLMNIRKAAEAVKDDLVKPYISPRRG